MVAGPRVRCCALLGLLFTGWTGIAHGAYSDEAVKAAFLYRFTGFVDWPAESLEPGHFTIAVLGSRPIAKELARLLVKYPVKNLPARVRLVDHPREALDAQMLYVGPSFRGDLQEVTDSLNHRPVLLVTDRAGALDQGSAVNFLVVDRRVRFEIALGAAQRAGLKVSSQLLAVAAHVRGAALTSPSCSVESWRQSFGHGCRLRVTMR
jgi:hypothetical protein